MTEMERVYSAVGVGEHLKYTTAVKFGFQKFNKTGSFYTLNKSQAGNRQKLYEKLFTTDTYSSNPVRSHSCFYVRFRQDIQ
jgi:hypothetical protein